MTDLISWNFGLSTLALVLICILSVTILLLERTHHHILPRKHRK